MKEQDKRGSMTKVGQTVGKKAKEMKKSRNK